MAASPREREEYERRFLAEARIAARLTHPGIVVVHDVGRDAAHETLYIALEHLKGRTVAEMATSPVPWREALRIVGRVAEALHYAHAQGVVHRDIKPANIMVLPSGEPKLMDFGIAKLEEAHLTTTGHVFGTPLYMSPEQALGQPVDARSDLFSLGSVAYTLLAGRAPFDAPNVPSLLARVAYQVPKPLSEVVPGLPPEIEYVVERAMAKSPDDRYPDARSLAEDIEDVLAGRPPRHRTSAKPLARAQGTLVSRRDQPTDLELQLVADAPQRARRRRPTLATVLLLAGSAGAYFYLHPQDWRSWRATFSRSWPSVIDGLLSALSPVDRPADRAPAPVAVPRPTVSTAAAAVSEAPPIAATPEADRDGDRRAEALAESVSDDAPAEPPAAAVEAAPAEADRESLSSSPSPSGSQTSAAGHRRSESGMLSIEFEHHLRRGTLQVWVDGDRVLDESFDGRVTRKILMFERRKGVVQQSLALAPGTHQIRVRVHWDNNVKTARISGAFKPGAVRRLSARRTGAALEVAV
jgi:serine/threonine-protein kinase